MTIRRRSTKSSDGDESPKLPRFTVFFWTVIGLLLTVMSTFIEAFFTNPPWQWGQEGIQSHSLGITYQIGAVLLTGCVGGKNAGALSQIAYVILGLFFLPIFANGGGVGYLLEPSFGYLLGFIPGAWVCGWLAFRYLPKIEFFALSALGGLGVIHVCGLLYLLGLFVWKSEAAKISNLESLGELIKIYSVYPFPSQLVLICVVSLAAFLLRKFLFY